MADLLLDFAVTWGLIFIKTTLFLLVLFLIAPQADLKLKKGVFLTLIMTGVYSLAHTGNSTEEVIKASVLLTIFTWIFTRKLFSLSWGKSLFLGGFYALLSVVLTDYANAGLNILLPDRQTLTSNLRDSLDQYTSGPGAGGEGHHSETVGGAIYAARIRCRPCMASSSSSCCSTLSSDNESGN
jgi:hypothetical protein